MSSDIIKHFSNYFSTGLIAAIGGILSFPILTRNLSVEDYGLIGLVTSSIAVAVALGKLGIQHSIIRYFAQIELGNSNWTTKQLYSTTFISLFVLSLFLTVLWCLLGFFILPLYMSSEKISQLFLITSGVVFLRLFGSGVINFLRAQQSSGVVGLSSVLHRYVILLLMVVALWFDMLTAGLVLFFLLIAELLTVLFVSMKLLPRLQFQVTTFSPQLIRSLVYFGLPLMAYESLTLILRLSDRYVIEALLGVEPLGQYSASYNLTAYLDIIIISGLVQAVRPMYIEIWEGRGKQATLSFLESTFRFYVIIGIPLILGFSLVAPEILVILSGERYAPGTVIIPYVAISFFLEGAILFLGAGLHINKNTNVFLKWALVATVLNIGLNMVFVPLYGISAAAVVTIASYIVFMIGVTRNSFGLLAFNISFKRLLFIPLSCLFVYMLLSQIDIDNVFYSFFAKFSLATTIFSLLLLSDTQIREQTILVLRKLRLRNGTL